MYIARKIAYNVIVSAVGKVVSTALALVTIGLITRYLGKAGFGDYAVVLAFFSFFNAIADLGFYAISTREISRQGADEEKIVSNVFTLRVFSSLAVFLVAPILVFFFPYSSTVKTSILVVAGAFIFSSSYQVLIGIFQKKLAMDRIAISELVGKCIQLGLVYTAVRYNLGLPWVVGALVVQMFVTFLVVAVIAKKWIRFKPRIDFAYWKKFLRESYPMGISVFITFLYFKMDTILLSVMQSSADVGIYNLAYKIIENLTFFPAMVAGLVLPILSGTIFSHRTRFEEISNKTVKFFWVIITPLVVGTFFLAEKVIALVGGEGFDESAHVLRILIIALLFIFFGNLFNNILIAGNHQRKLMKVLAFCAGFNIVSNLIFIPLYSFYAAATTSLATELLVVLITGYLIAKHVHYRPRFTALPKIGIAAAGMALLLFATAGMGLLFQVGAGLAAYTVFLIGLKAIEKKEILNIIGWKLNT